jgi:putative transposase
LSGSTRSGSDGTEIITKGGKLFLATVLDVGSRRVVGFGLSDHHDAALAEAALQMAFTVRGGREAVAGVIFHSDRGSQYTAGIFQQRVGGCESDSRWAGPERRWTTRSSRRGIPPWSSNCAASSTTRPRRRPGPGVAAFIDDYNRTWRHSGMMSPLDFEATLAGGPEAA